LSARTSQTSRVIERITTENDRLRREFKAEKTAREELAAEARASKALVSQLKEKNDTLSFAGETHTSVLQRKERRLDELKKTLAEEVARRKRAEENQTEMSRQLGETQAKAAQSISEARMAQSAAEAAYRTLQAEYKRVKTRVDKLQADFTKVSEHLLEQRASDHQIVTKLELVSEQYRQNQEKSNQVNRQLTTQVQSYREVQKDSIEALDELLRVRKEMVETTEKMRWVMNLEEVRKENEAVKVAKLSKKSKPS
jgi:chromosome segregation ATPase